MSFRHNADGIIFINNFQFPLAWFLTQEPDYSGLPEGYIGRNYVPHKRHHITEKRERDGALRQMEGGYDTEDFLWNEGDKYIGKVQQYVDAYNLFLNPPKTAAEQAAIDELDRVNKITGELSLIDIYSIRAIREHLVKDPGASKKLKDKEQEAKDKRAEL